MYQFKELESTYQINVEHRLPDDKQLSYSSKITLEAEKQKKGFYLFTLTNRFDTLLNERPPENGMDIFMTSLGESLYPIELNVSVSGYLDYVINFELIKERWLKKSEQLSKQFSTPECKKYIEMSLINWSNEERFRKVLLRDSFIQFLFLPIGEKSFEITCENFPIPCRKMTYFSFKEKSLMVNKGSYLLKPAFWGEDMETTGGTLAYEQMPEGDLSALDITVRLLTTQFLRYTKHISIRHDTEKKRIVRVGWF